MIARVGGDEFCAVLVGADWEEAEGAAARLQEAFAEHNAESTEPFEMAISVGVAVQPPGSPGELAELVCEADTAMLEAKRSKRGASRR